MDVLVHLVFILMGFAALIAGADFLVKGGAGIAKSLGVSPLAIGLTIVAYGTSMPEFMASFAAMWSGSSGIALGNVFGSNIFNIAVVMGFAAALKTVKVEKEVFNIQLPIMLGVTLLVYVFMFQGSCISRVEGTILFLGIIIYTVFSFYRSRKSNYRAEDGISDIWSENRLLAVIALIVGALFLFLGGQWVVKGSIFYADLLGIPDRIVGATIVALGTSLPELMTTVIGVIRKQVDLGVGNAIGSCIFNLLMVIGGTALYRPIESVWMDYRIEMGFVIISAIIIWPLTHRHRILQRWHGIVLLAIYIIFISMLLTFKF